MFVVCLLVVDTHCKQTAMTLSMIDQKIYDISRAPLRRIPIWVVSRLHKSSHFSEKENRMLNRELKVNGVEMAEFPVLVRQVFFEDSEKW